jgi:hypothetical protein
MFSNKNVSNILKTKQNRNNGQKVFPFVALKRSFPLFQTKKKSFIYLSWLFPVPSTTYFIFPERRGYELNRKGKFCTHLARMVKSFELDSKVK